MSFGWSVGDIVAASSLLNKVRIALKDSGGASSDYQQDSAFLQTLSATLRHLDAFQAGSQALEVEHSDGLHELCEQIDRPLRSFLAHISKTFDNGLGAAPSKSRLASVPRKLQWALSTSKEVKKLRDRIAGPLTAILVILSQQIVLFPVVSKPFCYPERFSLASQSPSNPRWKPSCPKHSTANSQS